MITVLFFAQLKEQLKTERTTLELANDSQVKDVIAQLVARHPEWESYLSNRTLLCAINQDMAELEDSVKAGDEVAFFPPVTGG